ncbi:MAG: aminotransferase class V-fold PLP-dependent enzyme, partial [Oscillospiraceae bacterium]|nr:aminotransferase class V-fold PLP-dependent enzyme [Oscillospiraceae bacterium]
CARAAAADEMLMRAREKVATFIGAESANQVIFTSGTTDGMNRIVNILTSQPSYAELSTFAVSDLDHHSARLPWENLLHDGKIRKEFICDLDENFNIKLDSIPKNVLCGYFIAITIRWMMLQITWNIATESMLTVSSPPTSASTAASTVPTAMPASPTTDDVSAPEIRSLHPICPFRKAPTEPT